MRKLASLLFLLLLSVSPTELMAQVMQTNAGNGETIFDSFHQTLPNKGVVSVHQSKAIQQLVGARFVVSGDEDTHIKMAGYRAQVFSGNNQRVSKEEAFGKAKEINELFPDIATYVSYTAPFWKLRIGDFRSHEESYHIMRQLKEAFPAYAKEMYIVREEIKIPLVEKEKEIVDEEIIGNIIEEEADK